MILFQRTEHRDWQRTLLSREPLRRLPALAEAEQPRSELTKNPVKIVKTWLYHFLPFSFFYLHLGHLSRRF